jgi:hypothetical protein
MNAPALVIPDTLALGAALETGERLAGRIRIGAEIYATLLPPLAVRAHPAAPWNDTMARVDGALSYCDGYTNTLAMVKAGSRIAEYALDHGLYIPARDELECIYRNFKPGAETYDQWRAGDNPSSIPPGYPYTKASPRQTEIAEFCTGGAEALPEGWIWTSTQYAHGVAYAWAQTFGYGVQGYYRESFELEVVLVRRLLIR